MQEETEHGLLQQKKLAQLSRKSVEIDCMRM